MLAPEDQALAVGTAQNLLAALQLNEGLRGHRDIATGADAVLHSHNDRMLQAYADELIAHEHWLRNGLADLSALLVQRIQVGSGFLQLLFQTFTFDFQLGFKGGVIPIDFGQRVIFSSSRERLIFSMLSISRIMA